LIDIEQLHHGDAAGLAAMPIGGGVIDSGSKVFGFNPVSRRSRLFQAGMVKPARVGRS
jgi:hypothetical protein